jgi:hypothetical protein
MKPRISQQELKQIIHYDPDTGLIKKIKCRRSDWIGKTAGAPDKKGYIRVSINNVLYLAHHLAWVYMTGEWPDQVDHINAVKDDNRFSNLREATCSQNMHNQGKRKHNTSGFKGVSYHKAARKWTAQIKVNWKCNYLGLFKTPEEAHAAYCEAAKKHHGEFARFA